MGMGSGESMQLGFFHPDDADDTINIPPSFLPFEMEMPLVRAGCMHNIALSSMGIPYSWGSNGGDALGRVTTNEEQERTLTPVTGFVRSNAPFLDNEPIIDVAAGEHHSLFLSLSGAVYMCGSYRDTRGGLSFSDQDGLDGTPLGENTLPVHVFQMPSPAVAVFAGGTMNAALLTDQSLVTWGMFGSLFWTERNVFWSISHISFIRFGIFWGTRSEFWYDRTRCYVVEATQ